MERESGVVEDLVKVDDRKEAKGGLQGRCKEEEEVVVEGNGWHHWKKEQKLGGGAHQSQSVTDL
ncbi:hypothetical protein PPACK8108_LOCUS26368 [Phakopsora pachyrhizi]|uniref:Uncharacterized protein n=1 Tax=Phakopsora pachyrhizi TaxID=170000 RepID=A0AAV0BTP5_PHAPC|nr:hypothetical protein PPACK8108_LOCUS26368 [Phakopsora pachyrhizi]